MPYEAAIRPWRCQHAMRGPALRRCPHRRSGRRVRVAQEVRESLGADRLDEMPVEAGGCGFPPVLVLPPAGHCEHADRLAPGLAPDSTARLVAVDTRHAEVEKHHPGTEVGGYPQRVLAAVSRANF